MESLKTQLTLRAPLHIACEQFPLKLPLSKTRPDTKMSTKYILPYDRSSYLPYTRSSANITSPQLDSRRVEPNTQKKSLINVWDLSTAHLQQIVKVVIGIWLCLSLITFVQFNLLTQNNDELLIDTNPESTTISSSHNSVITPPLQLIPPQDTGRRIPLPLPSKKFTVVIMNYSRPRMIQESSLMRTILAHPNVGEVVMLHSNPKTKFEFVHPKVVNIDATRENDEMGLSLRFYFCQMASNDWVIHVDDDMEFSLATLSELLIEFNSNPKRIVGRFGRNLKKKSWFNGYSSRNTHAVSDVILTKLMVMERDMCSAFFEYAHLIMEDIVLNEGEGPLWNGEDIFMSLVANFKYGHKANYAMDWLQVTSAPEELKEYDNGNLDISGGLEGIYLWDWHW